MDWVDKINPCFAEWFLGFTEGEANFGLWISCPWEPNWPSFTIGQRADNAPLLEYIQGQLGIGYLDVSMNRSRQNPMVLYVVGSLSDCKKIAELFTKYPLKGRQQDRFGIWKVMLSILEKRPENYQRLLDRLYVLLKDSSKMPPLESLRPWVKAKITDTDHAFGWVDRVTEFHHRAPL